MGIVTVKGDFVTVLPFPLIWYIVATPVPWSATKIGRICPWVLWEVYVPGVDQVRVGDSVRSPWTFDTRCDFKVTVDGIAVGNSDVLVDREVMRGRQQSTLLEPLDGRSARATAACACLRARYAANFEWNDASITPREEIDERTRVPESASRFAA